MATGEFHPAYFETWFEVQGLEIAWPAELSIITAWPTTGEVWPPEKIAAADQRLSDRLQAAGGWRDRVTGYSPATGHAEPGWGTALGWHEACDLGIEFRQDAIYFVAGDELFVTFCDARRSLVRVGTFRDRLTIPGHRRAT